MHRHTNQEYARAIKNIQVIDDVTGLPISKPTHTQIWKKFLNIYTCLPDSHGKLAVSIATIIEKAFGFQITTLEAMGEHVRRLHTNEIKETIEPKMMAILKKEEGIRILQPIPRSATFALK